MSYTWASVPAAFGKYDILAPLGTGGMGEVFLARETGPSGFQRVVALKRLLPNLAKDADFVTMFTREALVAAQLAHSLIVPIYEFGEINGYLYLAMEYVHGENLGALAAAARKGGRPLDFGLCAWACAQVAGALEYAHAKTDLEGRPLGLVHRDISPHNVLISFSGDIKLSDFGVAHVDSHGTFGDIRGKVAYMSPEQAGGKRVDARSDLYSLGVVLFELLTGRAPFQAESNIALLERVRQGGAPRVRTIEPSLPDAVDDLVARALEDDPADRFQDARSMRLALLDVAEQRGFGSSTPLVLADRMRELFPRRAGQPLPMVAETLPGYTPTELQKPSRTVAQKKRSWAIPAGIVVGLGIAVLGGVRWHHSQTPTPALTLTKPPEPKPVPVAVAPKPEPVAAPVEDPLPPPPPMIIHAGQGHLAVTASLPCDVTVDGKAHGRTPLADLALPAGRHQVRCDGAGLALPAERAIHLGANKKVPLDFQFARINVGDLSPWAQVFIDGKKVDRTPTSLRVPAGTHKLRLLAPDGRESVRSIAATAAHPVFIDRW